MPDAFSFSHEKYILVGKVVKPHGLKGECKIFLFSGQPEEIARYEHIFLITLEDEISPPLRLLNHRVQKNHCIVEIENITGRDQSEQMVGMGILVDRHTLQQANSSSHHWSNLVGKDVFLESGEVIGPVRRLFSNGAQDVLVINHNRDEVLVPVISDIVIEINSKGIVINPPPGLLDMNSGENE